MTTENVRTLVFEQAIQWLATLPMLEEPERWAYNQTDNGFTVTDEAQRRDVCTVLIEEQDMGPLGTVPVVIVLLPLSECMARTSLSGRAAARGDLFSLLSRKLTPLLVSGITP